jgi:DNA-binding CsgD family transcriptional regulator
LARAHLVYGEWLRRGGRRSQAREHLRTAYDMLHSMGSAGFAELARQELSATGGTPRKRPPVQRDSPDLTDQEIQVARLARDGFSNPEIGARLFISAKTVAYHLGKVFVKLDISSRTQLEDVLT